jgi:tetratricopeptide (TPR) repeat protein
MDRPIAATDVTAWLDSFEPLESRVLCAASTFGATFWRGGVCAVAPELDPAAVDDALFRLGVEGVLARDDGSPYAGEDTWRFVDPETAAAVVAVLLPRGRAREHGRAAAWLRSAGCADAALLAGHLLRSERLAEAGPWCATAARRALAAGDYDGALTWSEHAITVGVDPTTEAAMRMVQTGIHDARGALGEAERCAREAWRVAPRGSVEWFRAASSLAVLSGRLLRPDALRELDPAIRQALDDPRTGAAAAGLALAVHPMLQAGQYGLADAVLARLEDILASGAHPEPTFPARVYSARALRALYDNDPVGYRDESARAAREYESQGELRFALLYWNNVGFALISLGEGEAAVESLRALVHRAESRDLHRIALVARHNLGLALTLVGRHGEACAVERAVIRAAEALGDAHLAALAWIYLGRSLLAAGDAQGALTAVGRGLPALSGQLGERVNGLAIRASALLRGGRRLEALASAEEGMRLLDALGSVEEGEALLRLAHVEALRAGGDDARADAALATAWRRLTARSSRVTSPEGRERFFGDVPEHARTRALARRAGLTA